MALAAVAVVLLGLEGIRRRRAGFLARSRDHRLWDRVHRGRLAYGLFAMHRGHDIQDTSPTTLVLIRYHSAMAEKYERASRSPWWPVEPDPPEPQ